MRIADEKSPHAILLTLATALLTSALGAQTPAPASAPAPSGLVTCPKLEPAELIRIPEIQSKDGKLRGTMVVSAEQECVGFRFPAAAPAAGNTIQWSPQWMRTMRGIDTVPATPTTPPNTYGNPLPGPTLRARVGDLVELTLLNQVDTGVFPFSIDRGDLAPQGGCDQTTLYPGTGTNADAYPDCFHGSSTANIHFHGTHTNPNTTGDNVFIEIRPSPRTKDQANKATVTGATAKGWFDEFFTRCEAELPSSDVLRQWPFTWSAFPKTYTDAQETLLKEYDKNPRVRPLWPTNAAQLAKGNWPQYYIGAYPYCYRIPEYKAATYPPSTSAAATSVHTHGSGSAEEPESTSGRELQMGQSPGTHWYHAHKHGSTAIDVANGMTGAFIIEGKYDDDLDAFYGAGWTRSQKVLVINQIGVSPNLERGGGGTGQGPDKGPDFSVNGRFKPIVKMAPGEVQLWRIVNTSGRAGAYFAAPPAGFQWKQLAQDGVQFNDVNYQAHLNTPITLYPGNRADILVMAPATAPAGPVDFKVQNEVDPSDLPTAYPMTLLSVSVQGYPAVRNATQFIPAAPTQPPFLADITDAEVKGTRKIVFASGFVNGGPPPSKHTIDGKQFGGEIGEVVLLNTVEEWKVSNETYGPQISHPFHIHINPFQVTEVFDPNQTLPAVAGSGTVTTTAGSAVVTGTGTTFSTLRPGDTMTINGAAGTVQSIGSDTSLTLRSGVKTGGSGLAYTTAALKYASYKNLRAGQCHIDPLDPDSWKPCDKTAPKNLIWWDVFPIPSGNGSVPVYNADGTPATNANGTSRTVQVPGYFKLRSRFVDYSGYYVIHCHILAHEDRGMMTIVEVAPLQSPYSHH
jgi:FtsP/CotA-like multicopper oxidase with cupredoxin domain